MHDKIKQYESDILDRASMYQDNLKLQDAKNAFHDELVNVKYAYNFTWMGVPIIQEPQDLIALQEIIWRTKPDTIIETGIAWGGSLLFYASMLDLLKSCEDICYADVIGVDIDIRQHTRDIIENHPLRDSIGLIEGSSIDEDIIAFVTDEWSEDANTMVVLDSNHTHDHVLAELRAYAPLVSKGCYCVVNDTGIEDLPTGSTSDRPWGKGNNPKTAVHEFLKENDDFVIDKDIEGKLLLTGAPDGYLRRVK